MNKHIFLQLACNFTKKLTRPQASFQDFPLILRPSVFQNSFLWLLLNKSSLERTSYKKNGESFFISCFKTRQVPLCQKIKKISKRETLKDWSLHIGAMVICQSCKDKLKNYDTRSLTFIFHYHNMVPNLGLIKKAKINVFFVICYYLTNFKVIYLVGSKQFLSKCFLSYCPSILSGVFSKPQTCKLIVLLL